MSHSCTLSVFNSAVQQNFNLSNRVLKLQVPEKLFFCSIQRLRKLNQLKLFNGVFCFILLRHCKRESLEAMENLEENRFQKRHHKRYRYKKS